MNIDIHALKLIESERKVPVEELIETIARALLFPIASLKTPTLKKTPVLAWTLVLQQALSLSLFLSWMKKATLFLNTTTPLLTSVVSARKRFAMQSKAFA